MKTKRLKIILAPLLVIVTFAVFGNYLNHHRNLLTQLKHVRVSTIVALILFYCVWFGALALITQISIRMYHKKMGAQENLLLSAYSSLVNFFGPGQSGPGLRAIYLKKKHNLRVKDYIFATLLYYAFYSIISAFFLCVGSRPWWQTAILVVAAGAGSAVVLKWYAKKSNIQRGTDGISPINLGWLFAATALQMVAQVAIYLVEVHAVDPHASFAQVVTYTGAANFALFVALTPGAIGIRESFLVFSQRLHHISNSTIITANVIDRAVYIVFLGLLFVLVLSLHAGKRFKFKQMTTETTDESTAASHSK